ncbi:WD40-repeat-containing domain protein [Amanita rubescens]|nr:WD40-repeat-containing domain protein [Amanita rubescens]
MAGTETEYTWIPPNFSSMPPKLHSSIVLENDDENLANFMRAAKWSPDGLSVLGHCENRAFQLFELPDRLVQPSGPNISVQPSASLKQPSPILDFQWYPTATRHDPASYCFVASVRESPVKLLDASSGRLRASYRIVDHCERQIAPHSMAFNLTANKLYCGFENAIEAFDIHSPGEGVRLPTTPSKKSKDGLKGIISALAFSPTGSHTNAHYAAGSLTPTPHNIVLFAEAQGSDPILYIGNNDGKTYGGVTQLRFHPTYSHLLYASFRGRASHGRIYAWDLRAVNSGASNPPYHIFQTYHDMNEEASKAYDINYNQKMLFDIDITGRWLSVGDQSGSVSVFDLGPESTAAEIDQRIMGTEPNISYPAFQFDAHLDAIGSVAFNPYYPLLLSTSGSRHFLDPEMEGEEQDNAVPKVKRNGPVTMDNSVKVWGVS